MNKFVFVVSHLGSDYLNLINALNNHPKIQIFDNNCIYRNPLSLKITCSLEHKLLNSSAIYGDCLLRNVNLQTNDLYSICKFIYLIDSAKPSLNKIIANTNNFNIEFAARYYCYRLRRIYEMMKCNFGVFVDTQKFSESLLEISKYLDLTESCSGEFLETPYENVIPSDILQYCEERYEYYLYKIRSINH